MSTFAVIQTGGKQYRVKAGDQLKVELADYDKDKSLKLDKVLLVSDEKGGVTVGRPFVKGAFCDAEVLEEGRGPKLVSFKYIRREKSATKIGHRQNFLKVKIKSVHQGS